MSPKDRNDVFNSYDVFLNPSSSSTSQEPHSNKLDLILEKIDIHEDKVNDIWEQGRNNSRVLHYILDAEKKIP